MKKVILVDGNNLLFRSYYATAYTGNIMKNKEGFPTNALYGFVNMINKIINEEEPKYMMVAFDIGKSNIVGKPISELLIERGSNVVICDSKTNNLSEYTRCADIIIIAIGKAKFLTKDMIKENSIIIDVGINRVDNKVCGDVDFDNVYDKVSMITSVPGGIGPMTISSLALNLYKAYELNKKEDEDR